jgi:uncharacterized membrane protein YccC
VKRWTIDAPCNDQYTEDPEGEWVEHKDVDRLITGALLHGKIGGLEHALHALGAIAGKGGSLADLRDWLERRIGVNVAMLECFRATGEIPKERPTPGASASTSDDCTSTQSIVLARRAADTEDEAPEAQTQSSE